MPKRIRPTEVTAAFRNAVASARHAGVDTRGWNLRMEGAHFMLIDGTDEAGGLSIVPGTGLYMGGYFAASFREAYDALHSMARAWEMVPRQGVVGTWPCWHVEASNGLIYGAAASTKQGALAAVQRRLDTDGNDEGHKPLEAEKVATWDVQYGTVLCYGEGRLASSVKR